MATLKPVFLPKAESKDEILNDLIKAMQLLVTDLDRIVRELTKAIDDLTP